MAEEYDMRDDTHRLAALVLASLLESYVLADQTPIVEATIRDELPGSVAMFKESVIAELSDLAYYLRNTYL